MSRTINPLVEVDIFAKEKTASGDVSGERMNCRKIAPIPPRKVVHTTRLAEKPKAKSFKNKTWTTVERWQSVQEDHELRIRARNEKQKADELRRARYEEYTYLSINILSRYLKLFYVLY